MTIRVINQVVSDIENVVDVMDSNTVTVVEIEAPHEDSVSIESIIPRSVSLVSEVE